MATLEKIRNRSALLIIVVGLALLAFILTDALRSGSTFFHDSKAFALNIGGEKISIHEYQARLRELQAMQEAEGNKATTGDENMQLNNRLAQEYINEFLVKQEAEAVGVQVDYNELLALVTGKSVQPSQAAAVFFKRFGVDASNPKAVADLIAQLGDKEIRNMPDGQREMAMQLQAQWIDLQKQIVNQRSWQKISSLISRSYAVNKLDAAFLSGEPAREVALVRTSVTVVPEKDIKITDKEIEDFYNAHKRFFLQKNPTTTLEYISCEVRPSAKDYERTAKEMNEVRTALEAGKNVNDVLRNYNEKFNLPIYFTASELQEMGLPDTVQRFIKTATVGEVNKPVLENDGYALVKIIGKKTAPEALQVSVIQLDSASSLKVDSMRTLFDGGTSFATLSDKYNANEQLRESKGLILTPTQYGGVDSTLSEARAAQMGLDTVFKQPTGSLITFSVPGSKAVMLLHTAKAKPDTEKYKFAYVRIEATPSEVTYNEKRSRMNEILMSGKAFPLMAKDARQAGLNVQEKEIVEPSTPSLMGIASSREVVSWAIRSDKGAISDKLFVCGNNNVLIIPTVKEHTPAGFRPIAEVKDQIKVRLLNDKRGEKLAADLKAKNLATLGDYAAAMSSKVDTLAQVSYVAPQQFGYTFNGKAMVTPVGKVSAPFFSGSEVFVLQPIREESKIPGYDTDSQLMMQRQRAGGMMGQRAFRHLYDDTKIVDNRAAFF